MIDHTDPVGAQLTVMFNASPQFLFHRTASRTPAVAASNSTKMSTVTLRGSSAAAPQFYIRPLLSSNNLRFIRYHVHRFTRRLFSVAFLSSVTLHAVMAVRIATFHRLLWVCTMAPPFSLMRIFYWHSIFAFYTFISAQALMILFDKQDFERFYHRYLHSTFSSILHSILRILVYMDHRFLWLDIIKGREFGSPEPFYTRNFGSLDTANIAVTDNGQDMYTYLQTRLVPTWMTMTAFKATKALQLEAFEVLNLSKLKRAIIQRLQHDTSDGSGSTSTTTRRFWNVHDRDDTLQHLVAMSFTHYMVMSGTNMHMLPQINTQHDVDTQVTRNRHHHNHHQKLQQQMLSVSSSRDFMDPSVEQHELQVDLAQTIPLSYSYPCTDSVSQGKYPRKRKRLKRRLSTMASRHFIDTNFYQPTYKNSPRHQHHPLEDYSYQEAIELVPKQHLQTTYTRNGPYPLERKFHSSIQLETLSKLDQEDNHSIISYDRPWFSDSELDFNTGTTSVPDWDDNDYYYHHTDDEDSRHDRDALMNTHTSDAKGVELDTLTKVSSPRRSKNFCTESRESPDKLATLSPTTRKFKDLEAKWLNVGTKIGLRLLTSDPLQNNLRSPKSTKSTDSRSPHLITKPESQQLVEPVVRKDGDHDSEDMDDILGIPTLLGLDFAETRALSSPVNVPLMKPVHSLWTSPSRGHLRSLSSGNLDRMSHPFNETVPSSDELELSPIRQRQSQDHKILPSASSFVHSNELVYSSTADPRSPDSQVQSSTATHLTLPKTATTQLNKNLHRPLPIHASSRSTLFPGVKMVVPIFKMSSTRSSSFGRCYYQMSTVLSCKRIFVADFPDNFGVTNCLEIRVLLDKSFLRNAKYAEMTLRVFDREHMPRHSKFPIGSCVCTAFGIGVLVGWRLEDDCHIVRSLWNKRGAGSARAFLNRESIHTVVEAAVGFSVETIRGNGKVIGYIQGGGDFRSGKFLVHIKTSGRYSTVVSMVNRSDIVSCKGAKFLPIVEQIRESANYLIQLDNYESSRVLISLENDHAFVDKTLRIFSEGFELLLTSVIKAIEEDEQMRNDFTNVLSSLISFLENFDLDGSLLLDHRQWIAKHGHLDFKGTKNDASDRDTSMLQRLFGDASKQSGDSTFSNGEAIHEPRHDVFVVLKLMMRTVTIARASCSDRPNLHLALSILYEIMLFFRTVVKVQKSNMSQISISAWNNTFSELLTIFGPIDRRLRKIAHGITERLATHGYIAKMRALQFIEIIASDDHLLDMLEAGEYVQCVHRVEWAIVQADILQEETLIQYRKALLFLYDNIAPKLKAHGKAAARSGKKFSYIARLIRLMATPRRSFLKYLTKDYVLDIVERVLIRVFQREQDASQMISIFSFNFRSFRQLRILSNMAISGKLLTPILDAADEEFVWAVSRTPAQTKDFLTPLSKLFSLGVSHFHQIQTADATGDWLDFLMEDDAIRMIQQLDRTLMLSVQGLCNDVREIMDILPYYNSIDVDILTLIDNVDIEAELKDAAEALLDESLFDRYIKEKSYLIVSKFLDYLPRISIPIERKEIGEGWCVSCRGRGGEDLKLSNLIIQKEHVICRVLGSVNVILPISLEEKAERVASLVQSMSKEWEESDSTGNVEVSILNHIGELIRNAQSHGYYNVGVGGVCDSSTDMSSSPLDGLPISQVLRCAIDLWKNLEMDDDELLEIAIRDISYQIELCHSLEKGRGEIGKKTSRHVASTFANASKSTTDTTATDTITSLLKKRRFNPRKDPTLLYFEITKLNCSLEDFAYRIEMLEPRSIFDPVFVGISSLVIKNASIMIRVECRKDRVDTQMGDRVVPRIHLQEFDVRIEKVQLSFKETGADWLFNSLVRNFSDSITAIVRLNLKNQLLKTINATIGSINSYIEANPEILLKLLGITLDDLDMNTAWV